MRARFWELPLAELSTAEWEALCDGCGKCCLNKIEYEDDGSVEFTCVACKLLDGHSCQCSSYHNRHDFVPGMRGADAGQAGRHLVVAAGDLRLSPAGRGQAAVRLALSDFR